MNLKLLFLLAIPVFISAGKPVGAGAVEEAGKQTKEVIHAIKDTILAVMHATPKCVGNTIYQAGYNALAAPAHAVRDGVVAHPYAAGAVVATGIAVAGYRTFRPLSEKEKAEEAKAQGDIRAAALLKLSDDTADEYRTCLNKHARSAGTCDDKLK